MTTDFRTHEEAYREYYDEIEVFPVTHYKAAFQQRNPSMIDRSDLAVFHVEKLKGGSYSTMKYVTAQGVKYDKSLRFFLFVAPEDDSKADQNQSNSKVNGCYTAIFIQEQSGEKHAENRSHKAVYGNTGSGIVFQ